MSIKAALLEDSEGYTSKVIEKLRATLKEIAIPVPMADANVAFEDCDVVMSVKDLNSARGLGVRVSIFATFEANQFHGGMTIFQNFAEIQKRI